MQQKILGILFFFVLFHLALMDPPSSVVCDICHKSFRTNENLVRHLRTVEKLTKQQIVVRSCYAAAKKEWRSRTARGHRVLKPKKNPYIKKNKLTELEYLSIRPVTDDTSSVSCRLCVADVLKVKKKEILCHFKKFHQAVYKRRTMLKWIAVKDAQQNQGEFEKLANQYEIELETRRHKIEQEQITNDIHISHGRSGISSRSIDSRTAGPGR